jgi:flagellar basal body-associated protein FliL
MNRSLTILLGVGVVAVVVVLVVALISNTSGAGTTTTVAQGTVEIPIGVMVGLFTERQLN